MVTSRSWKVRAALAANVNLQIHLFDTLATDKKAAVRAALATNPNLSPSVWTTLSKDHDAAVLTSLKEAHPTIPEKADRRK